MKTHSGHMGLGRPYFQPDLPASWALLATPGSFLLGSPGSAVVGEVGGGYSPGGSCLAGHTPQGHKGQMGPGSQKRMSEEGLWGERNGLGRSSRGGRQSGTHGSRAWGALSGASDSAPASGASPVVLGAVSLSEPSSLSWVRSIPPEFTSAGNSECDLIWINVRCICN